jgi:hypothetical protein
MSLIPPPDTKIIIPPFDELTMMVFGRVGTGKTRFCSKAPKTCFISTEPGAEFSGAPFIDCPTWHQFILIVREIYEQRKAGTLQYNSFVIDIVDNLQAACRDYVCKEKGLDYPPENDRGKTWTQITRLWKEGIGKLMRMVDVRFISHTTQMKDENMLASGMKQEVDIFVPTFTGNKAAQYLDGILNAVGFCTKQADGQHVITFKSRPKIGAKDRTDVLTYLDEIPIGLKDGWQTVAKAYTEKAKELGYEIKSKRS